MLRIGETLSFEGRIHRLQGLEPMSVPDRRAELEDVETGRRRWVAVARIEQARAQPREAA